MMKVFIAILALCMGVAVGFAAANTDERTYSLREKHRLEEEIQKNACVAETGVNPHVLKDAVDNERWEAVDEKGKCFIFCMLKKNHAMDEQGNILINEMRKELLSNRRAEEADAMVTKCGALKGKGGCENAFLFTKCLLGDFPAPVMKKE